MTAFIPVVYEGERRVSATKYEVHDPENEHFGDPLGGLAGAIIAIRRARRDAADGGAYPVHF